MPKITIHNATTQEVIEREMNEDELAVYQADLAKAEAALAKEKELADKKLALLEKLGITEEEAKLLLS